MKQILLLITVFYGGLKISCAQPGKPDSSFGSSGIVTTDSGNPFNHNGSGKQVLLKPDGSMYIVIAVDGGTVIAGKRADGSPDSTYGINSFSVKIPIFDAHAALQADGKIVIAGKALSENYFYELRYYYSLARINATGSIDLTFGENGKIISDIGGYYDAINSLAINGNGQIIVAGFTSPSYIDDVDSNNNPLNSYGYLSLARYNTNGSPDYSFNGSGQIVTALEVNSYTSNSVAIQSGKMIVAGSGDNGFNLARYSVDGSLDNTFKASSNLTRSDGIKFVFKSLVIQNDGKIIVGGFWPANNKDFVVARYNFNGKLDSSFSGDGLQTTDFRTYNDIITSLSVQNDNKIVAVGYASNGSNYGFALARYNSNGSADNSFDGDGKKMTYIGANDIYANSVTIENTGKLILAGYNTNNNISTLKMARYTTDGLIDSSFNKKGTLTDSLKAGRTVFTSTAIQNDGKIVAAGYSWNGSNYDYALARYTQEGKLDNSFSLDGKQSTNFGSDESAQSLAIQNDGKIVIGGTGLARYNADGSLDLSFNNTGHQAPGFQIDFVRLQTDGKIVVAGEQAVARYNTNGTLDLTFSGDGVKPVEFNNDFYYHRITAIGLQADGKIVATGNRGFEIFSYNPDGSLNGSSDNGAFQKINFFPDWVDDGGYESPSQGATSLAIQSDGKIVIGGDAGFTGRYDYSGNTGIARYKTDGTVDSTFGDRGTRIITFNNYSQTTLIALQADNRIVVESSLYRGESRDYDDAQKPLGYAFARVNTNGNIDSSFSTNGLQHPGIGNTIKNLAVGDNKLYVVGYGTALSDFGFLTRYLLTDNKAPAVSLASPANNATYAAPATITLNATASDPDGTITSVQFYHGSALLKADSTSPYSFTVSNLAAGNYSFVAKATDNSGLVNNSATVTVSVTAAVTKAPIINITSPVNNATYTASSNITINATASDPDGTINNVKFYSGSTLLATDSTSPYGCTISAASGNFKFYAKATDNTGLTNSSAAVSVFMSPGTNKAPVVKLINPANNAIHYAPATLFVNVDARDEDGTIACVKFYMGSTLLSTDSTSPYSYTLTNLPVGTYSFVAKATDNSGLESNTATSFVPVLVPSNKAPLVNISNPVNNEIYTAGSAITLNATASDADGSITSIKFYNGSTLLKTDNTSPYSCTITNAAAGNYKFYAKATDNSGSSNSSATVYVMVNGAASSTGTTVTAKSSKISSSISFNNKSEVVDGVTIRLAPNPAHNILNIYNKGLPVNKKQTILIISASGIVMKTIQTKNTAQAIQLNVSSLASGIYFIKIVSGDKITYRQFLKM